MNTVPFMTDAEIEFLASVIKPTHRVWEWGSGGSTVWLADRCRRVTSVEHDPKWARSALARIDTLGTTNASVLYVPTDHPWPRPGEELSDGDRDTFRSYIQAYTGKEIDVILIDGRARVDCARQVADGAAYGPNPDTVVLIHDCEREEYAPIWTSKKDGGLGYFEAGKRVGNLMQLRPVL